MVNSPFIDPVETWKLNLVLRMFGWTGPGQVRLQMGFAPLAVGAAAPAAQNPQAIITLDTNTMSEYEGQFWDTFRQIAANPVGRVLLYRLLIEIRRTKGNSGATEKEEFAVGVGYQKTRNNNRSLNIMMDQTKPLWLFKKGKIIVNFSSICQIATKVYLDDKGLFRTGWGLNPYSVYLFHEMLHWFHMLRHPIRFHEEVYWNGQQHPLLNFYFGDMDHAFVSKNHTHEVWFGNEFGLGCDFIKIEELRTVIGSHPDVENYLPGDELAEDSYSCALNHQLIQQNAQERSAMRYGHSLRIIGFQHHLPILKAYKTILDNVCLINPEAMNSWGLIEGGALISKRWRDYFPKWHATVMNQYATVQFNPFEQIE